MPSEPPSADASQADATDPDPEPEPKNQAGLDSAPEASPTAEPALTPAVLALGARTGEPTAGEASTPALTRDTLISNLIATAPSAARVLYEEFGLPCYRCPARYVETLAEGLSYHGLDPAHVLARLS